MAAFQVPPIPTGSEPEIYSPIVDAGSVANGWEQYHTLYNESITNPEKFWTRMSDKYLQWAVPFKRVRDGEFQDGNINWFAGGQINACYNCVDKHIPQRENQVAIVFEGDEPGTGRNITFKELAKEVCRIANVFKLRGVKKGDVVTIYMPMIPETVMVMLACARIGAIHSVVFAGFSAEALRDRIEDCDSHFVVVSDEGRRGGKRLPLKDIVDVAVANCPRVSSVFTFKYGSGNVKMTEPRDVWMHDLLPRVRPYCACEPMDSEDPLFILYTSGSTGKPKGVAHNTAGYLLNAALTTHTSFDLREGDVYCCSADVGWVTGHTYIVYGPLCNGATTTMFESVPTYPDPYRYWDMVQRHKITQFYTAPTAIRTLMRFDAAPIANYDLTSLRVLGTVGEPINPEAWKWYYEKAGRSTCSVVDTYWQTETGAHIASNLPGVTPMKPGSCTLPYYGIEFALIDSKTGTEVVGNEVEGVLCIKNHWPSIARTVYGDHDRYLNVYMRPYPGYYFTGDGAKRDKDGFYWITGRVDDVINPSGHRIGTAEVESALVACKEVSEAAVVGFPHEVKGEGICCFVILREGFTGDAALNTALKNAVRSAIGPFATPDYVIFTDLPKTRSGKIMRRILRKIAHGESDSIGDVSTLADPSVVDKLVVMFRELQQNKK